MTPGTADPASSGSATAWATAWADTWAAAWPLRDAEAIVALQAPDGVHWTPPLKPPHRGREGLREYLLESFTDETARTVCQFGAPLVNANAAAVEYWAQVEYDGKKATISGCTVLEFDQDGLVAQSRDYSSLEPGHRVPPVD